jgi:cell division protein FtsL
LEIENLKKLLEKSKKETDQLRKEVPELKEKMNRVIDDAASSIFRPVDK